MIELPVGLSAELVPLSWLIGVWEGSGVLDYKMGDETVSSEFGQRISFSHDGLAYLNYSSTTWLLGGTRSEDQLEEISPLAAEQGYWRIARPLGHGDAGPGMLPAGDKNPPFPDAESVETLRNSSDGFDVEAQIVHPDGVFELYLGEVKGPRIDLSTDVVTRVSGAKEYSAATRLYGLVENHLLWAWDIAALGYDLRTHASGRLAKVD